MELWQFITSLPNVIEVDKRLKLFVRVFVCMQRVHSHHSQDPLVWNGNSRQISELLVEFWLGMFIMLLTPFVISRNSLVYIYRHKIWNYKYIFFDKFIALYLIIPRLWVCVCLISNMEICYFTAGWCFIYLLFIIIIMLVKLLTNCSRIQVDQKC